MNIDELLTTWEEIYKKGQLTFWIMLALKDSPKQVSEIKEFIETMTNKNFSCEEQSLYRSLRKFASINFVTYTSKPSQNGPDYKLYELTSFGKEILQKFIDRNILIFANTNLINLLKK